VLPNEPQKVIGPPCIGNWENWEKWEMSSSGAVLRFPFSKSSKRRSGTNGKCTGALWIVFGDKNKAKAKNGMIENSALVMYFEVT
jgi:hypothetical protein